MIEVSTVAAQADDSTALVSRSVAELASTAATLREEVDQYLAAMRTSDEERRRFERLPGGGRRLQLRLRDGAEHWVSLEDVALGGATLLTGIAPRPGEEVLLRFPDPGVEVQARVARHAEGRLAIAFRQDRASLDRIDRVLRAVAAGSGRQAA